MNNYLEKTKNKFQEIIINLQKLRDSINESINRANDLLTEFENNIYNYTKGLENLKNDFKQYEDLLLGIFDSNIIQETKKSIKNIEEEIKILDDNFHSLISFGLNELESEGEIEYQEFYKEIEKFSNDRMLNNSSEHHVERRNFINSYFYGINFHSNNKIIFDLNNLDIFLEQIKTILIENKNKLFISNEKIKNYIHNYIKSDKFDSTQNLKEFDDFKEIKDIKDFINFIGNEKTDCLGNSLYFNSSFNNKRRNEIYYPPYGWIGIGLKVLGKFDNDDWLNDKDESSQWANAYHPVSSLDSIPKIIDEGLKPGNSQDKENENDKRHQLEKVGRGVYLYQDIKTAEEKAIIIPFNNKRYKFVFMARVLIEEIREPESVNYWILNKDFIRIYRVLMKRI